METFLIVGGAVIFVGLCAWAARQNKDEVEFTAPPVSFRTPNLSSFVDPSITDDMQINEDTLPYAYLWKRTR